MAPMRLPRGRQKFVPVLKSFTAKFAGTCASCGGRYKAGAQIIKPSAEGWIHFPVCREERRADDAA